MTNAQFRRFKPEHRSGIVGNHTLDLDNQPVVGITWKEAALYCNWLSEQEGLPPAYEKKGESLVAVNPMTKGYRLPTDAEWEWAARNEGGGKLLRYPWGDALPVAPRSGNYADATARLIVQDVIPDYDDGFAAVGAGRQIPAESRSGLHDIGGNVAEWVHDYYTVSVRCEPGAGRPARPGRRQAARHPRRELETLQRDGPASVRARFRRRRAQRRRLPPRALRGVSERCHHEIPMRMLILLAVFWAAGSLLLAAESRLPNPLRRCEPDAATPKPEAKAGDAAGEAKAEGEGEAKPKSSIADQAEAALKAAAEADVGGTASEAAKTDGESGKGAPQDDTQAPPSGGSGKGPSPQRFLPCEQVRADFDVSFPIDI